MRDRITVPARLNKPHNEFLISPTYMLGKRQGLCLVTRQVTLEESCAHIGIETQRQWSDKGDCKDNAMPHGMILIGLPVCTRNVKKTNITNSIDRLVQQKI